MGIPFWGIKCKGCGTMHPVVMERRDDDKSPFVGPEELIRYRCPNDDTQYDYLGKEQQRFQLEHH